MRFNAHIVCRLDRRKKLCPTPPSDDATGDRANQGARFSTSMGFGHTAVVARHVRTASDGYGAALRIYGAACRLVAVGSGAIETLLDEDPPARSLTSASGRKQALLQFGNSRHLPFSRSAGQHL
jgi:hypothetical protein